MIRACVHCRLDIDVAHLHYAASSKLRRKTTKTEREENLIIKHSCPAQNYVMQFADIPLIWD